MDIRIYTSLYIHNTCINIHIHAYTYIAYTHATGAVLNQQSLGEGLHQSMKSQYLWGDTESGNCDKLLPASWSSKTLTPKVSVECSKCMYMHVYIYIGTYMPV